VGRRDRTTILRFLLPALGALLWAGCASTPAPTLALADEYYNLGNAWSDLKKFDLAANAYQKALGYNPGLKAARVNLAKAKADAGDAAGALALVGPLAQADPDNLVLAQHRAWLTAKVQGPAAAADLYVALAARLPGDGPTQFNAGLCLQAAARYPEALACLQAWKGLDGKGWAGLSALAALLDRQGSPQAAGAWLDAASALPDNDPRRFAPLASRARDLEAAELWGEAVAAWKAALAVPTAEGQARGEAQFRLGSDLLLHVEDFDAGAAAVVAAWKAGYHDEAAWKGLRADPALKFGVNLEAELLRAGVQP